MQSFQTTTESSSPLYTHSSFFLRGDDDTTQNPTLFWDIQRSFQQQDAVDLSSSCSFSPGSAFGAKSSDVAVLASNLQCATFNTNIGGGCASTGEVCIETGQEPMFQRGTIFNAVPLGNENWGDSGMADNSQQTEDTSTDVDTDDKNQVGLSISPTSSVS